MDRVEIPLVDHHYHENRSGGDADLFVARWCWLCRRTICGWCYCYHYPLDEFLFVGVRLMLREIEDFIDPEENFDVEGWEGAGWC